MTLYAKGTTVSVGKTQADLRRLIEKYEGQWIGVVTDPEQVHQVDQLAFKLAGVPIRFEVKHPQRNDAELRGCSSYNLERNLAAEYRRRWREIHLIVKSRLIEATQLKRDVREVFMAQLVTKTGRTVWEMSQQDLGALLSNGKLQDMLALPDGNNKKGSE